MKEISPIKSEHLNAFRELDAALKNAVEEAKNSGVAQGLIVSLLHAHSTKETLEMFV